MFLYHYYEKEIGAFKNLSDLPITEAQDILNVIKRANTTFASHRYDGYLERRAELEKLAKEILISKGGKPLRQSPHYMVVGECVWLNSWYCQGEFVKVHISKFDTRTLSFSYGDMFPTFSPLVNDGKEYRKQIYTYDEILKVIDKYGLPQEWNKNGEFGPERYVEVQVWSDDALIKYYYKSY
jgi:hypothetical protein